MSTTHAICAITFSMRQNTNATKYNAQNQQAHGTTHCTNPKIFNDTIHTTEQKSITTQPIYSPALSQTTTSAITVVVSQNSMIWKALYIAKHATQSHTLKMF